MPGVQLYVINANKIRSPALIFMYREPALHPGAKCREKRPNFPGNNIVVIRGPVIRYAFCCPSFTGFQHRRIVRRIIKTVYDSAQPGKPVKIEITDFSIQFSNQPFPDRHHKTERHTICLVWIIHTVVTVEANIRKVTVFSKTGMTCQRDIRQVHKVIT